MFTDLSQVDVALFPSFKNCLSLHLFRFSFYINNSSLGVIHVERWHYCWSGGCKKQMIGMGGTNGTNGSAPACRAGDLCSNPSPGKNFFPLG